MTPAQVAALDVLRHFTVIRERPDGTLLVRGVDGLYEMSRGGLLRSAGRSWPRRGGRR